MLPLTNDQRAAVATRHLMLRFFLWVEAVHPLTGDPSPGGVWNDVGPMVIAGRTYHGSGTLIGMAPLTAKGDMTIPGLQVTLGGVSDEVVALVRGKSVGQAPIDIRLGLYDVETKEVLPPLIHYFIGFIDAVSIKTPAAGGESSVVFTCESTSRVLTVSGTATRSPASCRARAPVDGFYDYTAAQRSKPLYFGRKAPVTAAKPVRPGIR
jgi:hypothetical protein